MLSLIFYEMLPLKCWLFSSSCVIINTLKFPALHMHILEESEFPPYLSSAAVYLENELSISSFSHPKPILKEDSHSQSF